MNFTIVNIIIFTFVKKILWSFVITKKNVS